MDDIKNQIRLRRLLALLASRNVGKGATLQKRQTDPQKPNESNLRFDFPIHFRNEQDE